MPAEPSVKPEELASPSEARSDNITGAVRGLVNVNTGDAIAIPAEKLAAAMVLLLKLPAVEALPSDSVTDRANAPL